jgi:aspartate-semialdehyde dehydrogenase
LQDLQVKPVEINLLASVRSAGKDETFVSRMRSFDSTGFVLWNVINNIRVGAATNTVRILKKYASLNDVSKTCK